jgi:hypothetical protein
MDRVVNALQGGENAMAEVEKQQFLWPWWWWWLLCVVIVILILWWLFWLWWC